MAFQFRKEAIEEDLNTNFPSQGQGNPPLYYSLSEVVVPTYSINSVAEGSSLPENLQTAWDFSTDFDSVSNTTTTIINTTGFWLIDFTITFQEGSAAVANIALTDGVTPKNIWYADRLVIGTDRVVIMENKFVVFVNSGQSVTVATTQSNTVVNIWHRQIADINGNLVNPLGFSFA